MAGHSKWANTKHRKGALDKKRAKIFSKLAKFITIAARDGGGDPAANPRLRLAVDKARAANMPKDNIERAIAKGTGEGDDSQYFELVYEGYAPGQVAVVIDILTDNKNRTASELRKLFDKKSATLGNPGSVSWMFETRGLIEIPVSSIEEDDLMELVLEAGAEDVKVEGEVHQVLCAPENFSEVRSAIEGRELEPSLAEVTRIPTTTVEITDVAVAQKIIDFINDLEDHDDVNNIHSNFDMPDEVMEKLEG